MTSKETKCECGAWNKDVCICGNFPGARNNPQQQPKEDGIYRGDYHQIWPKEQGEKCNVLSCPGRNNCQEMGHFDVEQPKDQGGKCKCACHENKLKKPYEHDRKCCDEMNGFVPSDEGSGMEWEKRLKPKARSINGRDDSHQTIIIQRILDGYWEDYLVPAIRQLLASNTKEVLMGVYTEMKKGYEHFDIEEYAQSKGINLDNK